MAVVESQDDRKAWAGKDLQRSSSAALLPWAGTPPAHQAVLGVGKPAVTSWTRCHGREVHGEVQGHHPGLQRRGKTQPMVQQGQRTQSALTAEILLQEGHETPWANPGLVGRQRGGDPAKPPADGRHN